MGTFDRNIRLQCALQFQNRKFLYVRPRWSIIEKSNVTPGTAALTQGCRKDTLYRLALLPEARTVSGKPPVQVCAGVLGDRHSYRDPVR